MILKISHWRSSLQQFTLDDMPALSQISAACKNVDCVIEFCFGQELP